MAVAVAEALQSEELTVVAAPAGGKWHESSIVKMRLRALHRRSCPAWLSPLLSLAFITISAAATQ